MTTPLINYNPPKNWVNRLQADDQIWLVKERRHAFVSFPFERPRPGYSTGRLVFRRVIDQYLQPNEVWFVSSDGCGIDGSLLMQPLQGHLGEEEVVPQSILARLEERIIRLEIRIQALERQQVNDVDTSQAASQVAANIQSMLQFLPLALPTPGEHQARVDADLAAVEEDVPVTEPTTRSRHVEID